MAHGSPQVESLISVKDSPIYLCLLKKPLDNLFSDDVPCRVIICFIQNDRKLGNYQNPYDFRRHWDVVTLGLSSVQRNREQLLEAKLEQLEKTLQLVLDQQTTKGKGRGKKSSNPKPSTSQSFFNRIRSFHSNAGQEQDQVSQSSHQSFEEDEDEPPPYSDIEDLAGTKRIYIKKVELLLNGTPLGNSLMGFY